MKTNRIHKYKTKVTAIRERSRDNKKIIYAIQFKDLPFPEIDKYVCLPYSWIIHRLEGQKILAAYPQNEAPFVTRNRTKKREIHSIEWRYYIGFIKFESGNYEEVVQWIEEMIAKGADEPEIQDPPAGSVGSRQLRSAKNPVLSGILPEKPHLAVKTYNPRRPLPRMLIRPPLPLRPWKPKPIEPSKPAISSANAPSKDQPVVENPMMQNAVNDHSKQESVDTSAQSPPKLPDDRQPSPKPANGRQPSPKPAVGRQPSPVQDEQLLDIDDSDVELVVESEPIEEERPPSSGQAQPDPPSEHHYSLIELRMNELHNGPQLANDSLKTLLVQNSTARPPSRVNQPHDYPQPVSTPSSKPQLQGMIRCSSEVTHRYQNSHLQGLVKTVPSTTYHIPTPIDLSSQQQIPAIRRKSSAADKKPAQKKARVERITKHIPTSQQSLFNKQPPNYAVNVGEHRHLQGINTSAAQNLSHLAQQTRFYEPSQLQYLQQIARMQDVMINRPNMPYVDQRSYLTYPNTGIVLAPRKNQWPVVSTNQMPELMRHVTTPSVAAPQRQDPPSYQDPRTVNPLEPQSNYTPEIAERPIPSPEIIQQVSNDRRNNLRKDLLAKLSLGPMRCIEISADLATCPDSETQASSESQETQSKIPEKNVYQHPKSKKLVADQATEMESDDHHDNGIQSSPESIETGCETEKHPTKEQESQEVSDSEMVNDDEELSDSVSTGGSDCANEDYSEEDTLASITDERSMDAHNIMPAVQEKLSEFVEDELLEVHGLLLTKMYNNFVNTEEYYNNLRVDTLGCLKLYETILNKPKKVNVIESLTNPTSEAPEVPQVQETPAPAPEQNSNDNQNNNSSVKNSPKKSKPRYTFVLPPEYDPNDSRWTLKHREPGPKLMELMPRSRVYVRINEYNKCIRSSNDCRTLARSLLTAVFSKNALSVCSPTGAKARAFNNVKIDVRPGLDEDSRLALLAFIDKYGKERKWNTSDTAGIMSSIRTKIQDMRNKYGKTKVV